MSRRKSGSGAGFGNRRMAVEQLEGRSLLAGVVSAFVSGGSLFINGDNTDNAVVVQDQGDGNYTVTGFDFGDVPELTGFKAGPTTINGGEDLGDGTRLFTGVTNDIIVDLKKGNDGLAMGNTVSDLETMAEDCFGFGFGMGSGSGSGGGGTSGTMNSIVAEQFDETLFSVPRNLVVNTGDGNDYVVVNANVGTRTGGVAFINTGNGHDGVAFGSPFASAQPGIVEESAELNEVFFDNAHVADDLIILTGNGNDNVCVTRTTAEDLLTVQTGEGSDSFDAEQIAAGHAVVTSGGGNDLISLVFFALDRELVVDSGAGNDEVLVADFSMGHGEGPASQSGAGYATIVTGAGDDAVIVSDFECDGLYINTGAGNDGVELDTEPERITAQQLITGPLFVGFGDITNQLTIITGAGNDFLDVEFISARNIVIDTGAGNDGSAASPISIVNVQVSGSVTAVTGAGNDFLNLFSFGGGEGGEDPSSIGDNLVVDTGAGNDTVQITDQDVGKDLILVLGAGNNNAAIGVPGAFDVPVQGEVSVGRNLTVVGGSGRDNLIMGNLEVLNDLFAALGAGNDFLFLNGLDIGRNATIDTGAGNDTVFVGNTQIVGRATVLMGAGNDSLSIGNSTAAKLIARGGAGRDTFNNDLGIDGNGTTDTTDVKEFEIFASVLDS